MPVVSRFAPSPTGFLHIGGARTALFNWLFARHHGGTFRLRIEDTDRARSTQAAIDAILDSMAWLGLDWDGETVFQSRNEARHAEVARQLLAEGRAYRCWSTPEELTAMRERARAEGKPMRYDGTWRDRDPAEAPAGAAPVIRIRMPQEGRTVIADAVQGEVAVDHAQLDDFVLLRADGTPTYMLAVVVDDHDMGVTHVIRGDDHLNNAFRQYHLWQACDWDVPVFAHIPLIHGADGAKLSKRHGAVGLEAYRGEGCLPEAMRNYLLRLGWAHGDDEVIATERAIEWFGLEAVGRSPARFDRDRLDNINGRWLRVADDARLVDLIVPEIEKSLGHPVDPTARARLLAGMDGMKQRVKTLVELAAAALFYCRTAPFPFDERAAKLLTAEARALLGRLATTLADLPAWEEKALEEAVRGLAGADGVKLGDVAQPLRAALTGSMVSPGIFEVMAVLGRDEAMARLAAVHTG